MKRFLTKLVMGLSLLTTSPLLAQEKSPAATAPGVGFELGTLDDWVQDNIDPDALKVLSQLDDDKVRKVLTQLQLAMSGTNIFQLNDLRETARQVIPILQKYEETSAYGDWMQTRLDYLEAAQQLEKMVRVTMPKSKASSPTTAPTLKMERQFWTQSLHERPWPPLAKAVVPQLKTVFISERMPPELVWLAEVESSFNAKARSPAGAAGMFQLMPQTARNENLSTWPWDERLQPEKSARAAARYLRGLHEHYGDWDLALAAYNAGQGRVDKILKQRKAHSFEAITRYLPVETQMYVPKVEATVRKREGHDLQDLKVTKG